MQEKIAIFNRLTEQPIASGIEGEQVQLFEGTWYFDQNAVDMADLVITDRIYVCPYKGRCYWIDLKTAVSTHKNVAFTYFETFPGYEFIQDRIGFYAGGREATIEQISQIKQNLTDA